MTRDYAIVVRGDRRVLRADSPVGIVTKERIAESVADSLTFRTRPELAAAQPQAEGHPAPIPTGAETPSAGG